MVIEILLHMRHCLFFMFEKNREISFQNAANRLFSICGELALKKEHLIS